MDNPLLTAMKHLRDNLDGEHYSFEFIDAVAAQFGADPDDLSEAWRAYLSLGYLPNKSKLTNQELRALR